MSKIGSVENHRERERGALVYPVYSRRSQGLSMGINLFPDRKYCSFDCPYCEVFPFETDTRFSLEALEADLRHELIQAQEHGLVVRDICFSGNGEPTRSPFFREALEAAARIRDAMVPAAALVVISNGTGLLERHIFDCLCRAAQGSHSLKIWLKLDAGTESWYRTINRSAVNFEKLLGSIMEFAACAPFTIQTMLCTVQGKPSPPEEAEAWEQLVVKIAEIGDTMWKKTDQTGRKFGIEAVQIYSKARPAPEDPLAEALPLSYLDARAASLKKAFEDTGLRFLGNPIAVQVYL
jgi:histidinol dehydrogenase